MTKRVGSVLFLSHHVKHTRNKYLVQFLEDREQCVIPSFARRTSSTLSLSTGSAANILFLGLAGLKWRNTIHLDGIDVFIHPFIRSKPFLHDYHVPLVTELMWHKLYPMAVAAHTLMPECLNKSKVVIAPNSQMLNHAAGYTKLPEHFVIPNYPPQDFFVDVSKERARTELGLDDQETIVLFIGGTRLREVYGIDLLLKSWLRVRKKVADARLYVLGPCAELGYNQDMFEKLDNRGITFVGRVNHSLIPKWISSSDLCVSQRTPGFPTQFYNIHDSLKLSEYALFERPIVAAGYSDGKDYISTETKIDSYSRGIIEGIRGNAPRPTPHTWEENIPKLKKAYDILLTYSKE